MSRTSMYDSLKWLKKIKELGFNQFTTYDLKENIEYKHGYFLVLSANNFITSIDKIPSRHNSKPVNVWKINEPEIKRHKFGHVMYED